MLNRNPLSLLSEPSERQVPRVFQELLKSKYAAVVWTAARIWLGVMWAMAGWAKLFGAENGFFLHHNGAGVAGLAAHGVPAYTWWGSFLHGFVVPNSGSIGVLVAFGEFAIGLGLIVGCFTRVAAFCSLILLFTYVMSGVASVCALYALFAIVIMVTWRTSSWLGVDGLISGYRSRHSHRPPALAVAGTHGQAQAA